MKAAIEAIRAAALNTEGDNIVSYELTYQQAFSIYLRSQHLKVGEIKDILPEEEKRRQIDICYKQRGRLFE